MESLMQSQNIADDSKSSFQLYNSTSRLPCYDRRNMPIFCQNRSRQSQPRQVIKCVGSEKLTSLMEFAKQVKKIRYIKQFIHNLKRTIVPSMSPYQQHSFAFNQMPGRINTQISAQHHSKLWKTIEKIYEIVKFFIILVFFLTVSIEIAFTIGDKSLYTIFGICCVIIEIVQIIIFLKKNKRKHIQSNQKSLCLWTLILTKQNFFSALLMILTVISIFFYHETIHIVLSLLYLFQIIEIVQQLKQIQNYIISSTNLQNYWNISKIILCNFFIAHCLSILLNLITQLQHNQQNWYLLKNLHDSSPWHEKYIWGCYWGTTIMLTLGFGDISANNLSEAICLIFIMTFSCVILAYNIAEVSKILSKMGQLQLEKNKKLKTLYNLSNSHTLSDQLHSNLKNSIEKSFELKKQINFDQEKQLISSLPQKLEKEVGKEINKRIFGNIIFFKDLTQSCQLKIAQCIEKFMAHPDEILLKKGDIWKMFLIKKGNLCLTYRQQRSNLNGISIDNFKNESTSINKLVSLNFIKKKRILGDLKSLAFSLLLTIQNDKLEEILKSKDETMYEYYCVERDRDYKQEAELYLCSQCQQDKHSQIHCPRLHYCPLKEHLIKKTLRFNNYLSDSKQPRVPNIRKLKSYINSQTLKNFAFIEENVLCKIISQDDEGKNFLSKIYQDPKLALSMQYQDHGGQNNIKLDQIQKSINKVLDCLANSSQNLQVDSATNYKGYFPKFNPQNLYKLNTIKSMKSKFVKKKFTKCTSNYFSV